MEDLEDALKLTPRIGTMGKPWGDMSFAGPIQLQQFSIMPGLLGADISVKKQSPQNGLAHFKVSERGNVRFAFEFLSICCYHHERNNMDVTSLGV